MSGLAEASTNFDLENVEPFLERVASHVDGFEPAEVTALATEISAMSISDEKTWEFSVTYNGQEVPLHVRAFMDDIEAPDLFFFTTPELAEVINSEIFAYFDELGM